MLDDALNSATQWLWKPRAQTWQAALAHCARIAWCSVREILKGDISLRAMSLVYTTLLSLVPLLALSFSLMKAMGVHNRIEPTLLGLLEPLGTEAERITGMLIGFVDNVQIGVLGSLGVALLFYTVLAMIQKVEASFNSMWHTARARPLGRRISEYLVVLIVGPLAVSLILGVTASIMSNRVVEQLIEMEVVGTALYMGGRMLPYFVMAAVFTFMFAFVPNTTVRLRAAAAGGITAGILWQSAIWGFAGFVSSASNYNAIYSSFAIMIFLLIWLYLGWLILLIGCQISFFVQHPEYLAQRRSEPRPNPDTHDEIAMLLMTLVSERFSRGDPPCDAETLTREVGARPELTYPTINELVAAGVLTESESGSLLPTTDPANMSISELLQRLKGQNSVAISGSERFPALARLASEIAAARDQALAGTTISELHSRKGE